MASRLYGTRDAAAYLGLSKGRVLQLVWDGRLKGQKTSSGWQFEQEELDRLRAVIRPYRRRTGDDHGTQPGRDR